MHKTRRGRIRLKKTHTGQIIGGDRNRLNLKNTDAEQLKVGVRRKAAHQKQGGHMDYKDQKITEYLRKISKSLDEIDKRLETLNNILIPLAQCVETYANGKAYFQITDD